MPPKRSDGVGTFPITVEPPAPPPADPAELYAALDLGTNSCRMLIAQPKGNQFHVVDSFSKSVQLGQGLESSGRLSRSAMVRTVQALRICERKLRKHQVKRMRLVATEACRRATNARDFMAAGPPGDRPRARDHRARGRGAAGRDLLRAARVHADRTASGGRYRRRFDRACLDRPVTRGALGTSARDHAAAAAGFTGGRGPFPAARVVDWISVPLGVATLREQFHDVQRTTRRDFALMSWYFEEQLASFSPMPRNRAREGFQIIGTSGTVTTVAASHLGLKRYDRTKVDGLRMTSDQIDRVIRDYLFLGPEGRRNDPRIGRDRHTLIMSGAAILQALMRVWPTDRLSVADRGLREGLLYAQMSADGVLEDGPF
jgi:exopolyphosphatase / guanosine-5'-triphosphate,3'-diphosphate pyrophosphatase